MKITLMADRFGYLKAVEEVREDWLENVLAYIGVDFQEVRDMDQFEFFEYLENNEVDILFYPTIGAMSVRFEDELVGEWGGPELIMKQDNDGSLYYEITIECWSIDEESFDLSS